MLFGGGAYQNSSKRANTSIPHRDYIYCFIFDLFYLPGKRHVAEQLQNEMQSFIEQHYNNGQERRVFWGTFGDVDISKPDIRAMYYEDEAKYASLQEIKQRVDPDDLFHTELTVQLPDDRTEITS